MNWKVIVPILACITLCGLITAFTNPQLSVELRNSDWDVSDWASIRRGQVGLVHTSQGDTLQIYALTSASQPAPASSIRRSTPGFSGNCYKVDSFDSGIQNRLGGYFNSYSAAPSSAFASFRRWEDDRRALTLDFAKAKEGFCGMWVHLFDFKRPLEDRIYFDTTPFSYLTFWVRAKRGSEHILLKASDARWERAEDSLPIGDLSPYLDRNSFSGEWQRVVMPLADLPKGLNPREMAALIFEATREGRGSIGIKDLAFCTDRDHLPDLSPPLIPPKGTKELDRALWIWNPEEILASAEKRKQLINFARSDGITDLFIQIPSGSDPFGDPDEILLQTNRWRILLSMLSESGLRAHALDGSKYYALPEQHGRVLATINSVVQFNRLVNPNERFYGVHYDIEPYLLTGFASRRRVHIIRSYLELLQKIAEITRASGLVFGLDIPFWYDSSLDFTNEPLIIEFNGVRKYLSEHAIDLADEICVMDYRTAVYGADGIVALAKGELEYAARKKKRLFIGLETTELPDEDLMEFDGPPSLGFPFNPLAGMCLVVIPGFSESKLLLLSSSGWTDLRRPKSQNGFHDLSLLWWRIRKVTRVPGSKLSFSRLGIDRLQRGMDDALEEFERYPSFAGYAIHDFIGYQQLLGAAR